MKKNDISFVIPAKNEEGSVAQLYDEIKKVMQKINKVCSTGIKKSYEIIFVDDGSTDNTWENIQTICKNDKSVKAVKLRGNFGKSTALQIGFDYTKGDIILTLDADLQDNPIEIPNFLKKLEVGYDLVSGWKKERRDPWHKVIPSRILNFATRKLTGIEIHDINCGFKAYRKEVIESLNLYGELYRFIPVFAAKQNFKVGEIPVIHRARKHGKTKFGIERNIKGFLDLITIVFLTGYLKRPGHFFGTLGLISFFLGFIIGLYITYLRVTTGGIQARHPLLFLGMLLMIIGVQLLSTGLLAEMLVHSGQKLNYTSAIKEALGIKI